jgi:plastocyanin
MTSSKRTRSAVGAAVALSAVLFLSGCGDDEQAGSGTTDTQSSTQDSDSSSDHSATESTPAAPDYGGTQPGGTPAPGGTASPGGTVPAEDVVIVIKDFAYTVPDTVAPGATIKVRNDDSVGHTVSSDESGLFDVAVGPGEEVELTVPAEAGEYSFFCKPHPYMVSTLVVG